MKTFKKNNVILRTNNAQKEKELKLRGFEEVKEKPKKPEPKKESKKASSE